MAVSSIFSSILIRASSSSRAWARRAGDFSCGTAMPRGGLTGTSSVSRLSATTALTCCSSTNGFSYAWDFGDGESSELENPSHVYDSRGSYWAELEVSNVCSSDSKSMQIINSYEDMLRIYPNPSNDLFTVDLSQIVFSEINWFVYDTKGALVLSGLVSEFDTSINFSLGGLSSGVYVLRLDVDGEPLQRKLLLVD